MTPLALLVAATMTSACAAATPLTLAPEPQSQRYALPEAPLRVVTTSTILGDWARRVAGDRARISSLFPANVDPHSFQPGARDVARIADADLVLSVGLNLEAAWLERLIENAATDPSKLAALGATVDPIELTAVRGRRTDPAGREPEDLHTLTQERKRSGSSKAGEGQQRRRLDPHFWFDPLRVKRAVSDIAVRLSVLDPAAADTYHTNARAYNQELDELHAWIEEQVRHIRPERRMLLTTHDSLRYFAERYEFRIVGAVIPGVTAEREPTAKEMVALVETIRKRRVSAIFTEPTISDRLARSIAEEADVNVVRSLYTGALGVSGSDADSYIGMMRANVQAIVEALR